MKSKFYLILSFLLIGSTLVLSQPQPPQNLTAVEVSGYNHPPFVKLSWVSASTMLRFNVYKKLGGLNDPGTFEIKASGIMHTTFNDNQVAPGNTYSYYVTAVNNLGQSEPSNKVEITLSSGGGGGTTGNVSGIVTSDATLLPIPNAEAMFFNISGCSFGFKAYTNQDGAFSITLPAGSYFMKTMAYGYIREFYDNVQVIQEATQIVVTDGSSLNVAVGLAPFVPPVTYTLSGTVKDSLDNPLMAFVKIHSIRRNTHHLGFMGVKTDSLGNFTVPVREGDTVVVYAKPVSFDYFPEFWDNKYTYQEADRIPVTGNITDINFVLSHRPVFENGISGTVTDTLDNPVESFVSAIRLAPMMHFKRYIVSTDEFGNYSFTNLMPGKYILLASPDEGFLPTFFRYDGMPTLNWRLADSVMVDETSMITGIDFTVHAVSGFGEGVVTGIVADNTGQPVNAAFVYALDMNGSLAGYAISDPSGYYTMTDLNAGDYQVYADMIEYTSGRPVNVSIDYINNLTQTANLLLSPESVTGVKDNKPAVAADYQLFQNYPNPFNPATTIKFSLPERTNVKISVYNLLGIQVAQVMNEVKNPGTYSVNFDGSDLASGVYFYKIEAGKFVSTKKLTLIK